MPDVIRVTDETTRAELEEALANLNLAAKRAPHVVEKRTTDRPTEWTRRHAALDAVLTDWQAAPCA